jgi:A/G-specific adenine glycosylase
VAVRLGVRILLTSAATQSIVEALLSWFVKNARDLPWRRTRAPYAIWISEIMLQQTQVKTVLPYWERWMRALPSVAALARARPEKVHKLWEGLGYYTRVRNMQRAAKIIQSEHDGKFPKDFEDILALPGIGRYTAGAICSIAFNQPKPILDGNVIRVLTRLFGINGNPRERSVSDALWSLAESLVVHATCRAEAQSEGGSHITHHASFFNQSLMELGALVCVPQAPRCTDCPLKRSCVAFRTGRANALPNLPARGKPTQRNFAAFVATRRGKFLVRQRPPGIVNAHLWEFPNAELVRGNGDLKHLAQSILGHRPAALEPLCTIKHSITRYRITLEAFRVGGTSGARIVNGQQNTRWLAPAQLRKLPFTSAHRKILHLVAG